MPIVVNSEHVIYYPVCGHMHRYNGIIQSPIMYPLIVKIALKINSNDRYINFECEQCKTKLIYDTKKETIKIKK